MAFTEDVTLVAGTPTKASEGNAIADNTDWLQDQLKLEHDLDLSSSTGRHLTARPLADSTYDLGTAALRWRVVYADTLGDTGQALAIAATSVTLPSGHAFSWAAGDVTLTHSANALAVAGGALNTEAITASGVVNVSTATNWQLGGVAFTGTMANLNTLRDDSMADALHRHSELSASDGTPNPAVQVDAAGNVGIGTTAPAAKLQVTRSGAGDGLIVTGGAGAGAASFKPIGTTDVLNIQGANGALSALANLVLQNEGGNVGIGVVPEAWISTRTALQIAGLGVLEGITAAGVGGGISIGANYYFDTTNNRWEYIIADEAAFMGVNNGQFTFQIAPAGVSGDDPITFTQAMTLTNAGQLLVGHTASVAVGGEETVQISGTTTAAGLSAARYSADAGEPYILLGKSRGATVGTFTAVVDNDVLGSIQAYGADGTDLTTVGGAIFFRVNGTPAANDIPGEIELVTYDGGAQTGSLILDAAGALTLVRVGSALIYLNANTANGESYIYYQEQGTTKYLLGYDGSSNYWRLWTTDSDGGGTDADVIRILDGQLTVDGNSTFDDNAFHYAHECGWHGPEDVGMCPRCGQGPVEWHDDVLLMSQAVLPTLRHNPEVLTKLERLGIVNTYGGSDLFISMNKAPWFLMSGLVQERSLREEQEASLREELALLRQEHETLRSEMATLRGRN